MLVRIKRKLHEEPLESVVLNREEANQKRATVNDLRHALQDASLQGPQVFRLLSTTPDASLPSNLLDTIARRKKEWASRPRRTSPRKNVKANFELQQQQQVTGNMLLQQSKLTRQARVWNCRRTKVQGFSVLDLSGDNQEEEGRRKRVNPLSANRMMELEQEAKARLADATTKSLKQARGWRKWQQEHRPKQPEQQQQQKQEQQAVAATPREEVPLPQQYAELLREYLGGDSGDMDTPVNFSVATSSSSSLSSSSSSSSFSSSSSSSLPSSSSSSSTSSSSAELTQDMDNSHDYNSDDDGNERDYVWDLYYCCGSELDSDPNVEKLTYRTDDPSDESEDPNEKEHDYSDEEEGDSSGEEESEDSDCVLNRRGVQIGDDGEEGDEGD